MTPDALEGKSCRWLLDSTTDAMIVVEQGGKILLANPPVERLFGYTQAEMRRSISIETLIQGGYRHARRQARDEHFQHACIDPISAGRELYGITKDGTEFPVDVSLSHLELEQGYLVLATIHDASARKRGKQSLVKQDAQLRESVARIQAMVDTAVDGIITIDDHGNIDSFNPAAEQMFGYTQAEVIGKNVSMLMPSPYCEEHDAYLDRYLETGEKKIIGIGREVAGKRKDSSIFPIELSVGEMRFDSRHMFTGIVRDITERKQAQEQQAQLLHELESANVELKDFAYVVSHDLKAPLRAIGSLADWIAADNADKFDDQGREQLHLLTGRVRRMDNLIDGILQYSRVGRVREDWVAVDLSQLVKNVIDLLSPPPTITVTLDNDLPTVTLEQTRILQVFQNLLDNAIKYMDKPYGEIRIGCIADGKMWRFSIRDNGPGIKKRHFERIFQLFQTLAPRDRVESTGVGLSVVRKIIEMYGGRIWLESEPGEGCTFFFTLPRTPGGARSISGEES